MTLSLLIPVLNEQDNIAPIYERLKAIAGEILPAAAEFIFIDDGSTDNSLKLLKDLAGKDPRARVISFSRNFGSHAALRAGFAHCKGEAAVNLSADSQEPIELIVGMYRKWLNKEKLVLGVRSDSDDPALRQLFSRFYCFLMQKFALKNYPATSFDVCLVDREIIEHLVALEDKNASIFNLILWLGYPYTTIPYTRGRRLHGKSKWTYPKLLKLFIDSFIPFSFFPIRFISGLGIFVSLSGFLYALFVLYNRIFKGGLITGWSSLIIITLILSGLQLIMLGVVSEYLWRTFDTVKSRPRYIIKETSNIKL